MYALFIIDCQSLRELRITSVQKDAALKQRNVGRIKCNGPVNFSQRGGVSSNTCVFPPCPPPPPSSPAPLLGNHPPPPLPQSSVVPEAGSSPALGLRQGRSLYRRVAHQIDRCLWHIWRVRAVRECSRSMGGRRWPAAAPPLPTPVLLLSLTGVGDK